MSRYSLALSAAMRTAVAGCGPSPALTLPPPAELPSQSRPPAAEPTEASAVSMDWRDLEAVNLCALIHNDEVAGLLGADPTRGDLEGVTGPACAYQVTPDGGSTV